MLFSKVFRRSLLNTYLKNKNKKIWEYVVSLLPLIPRKLIYVFLLCLCGHALMTRNFLKNGKSRWEFHHQANLFIIIPDTSVTYIFQILLSRNLGHCALGNWKPVLGQNRMDFSLRQRSSMNNYMKDQHQGFPYHK